jgi:hypothetical protein
MKGEQRMFCRGGKWLIALLLACPLWAHAAYSPLGLDIIPPVEFPPDDFSIAGARVSALWGRQRDVYGLDVGVLGNVTELNFVGLAVSGVFNTTYGSTTILGLQAAGAFNYNTNKTSVTGLQLALGVNRNVGESSVTGLQLALANLSDHTKIYGFQIGIYNEAEEVYGFQIGLVNKTTNLHGLQVGIVNFNAKGPLKLTPFLNVGF